MELYVFSYLFFFSVSLLGVGRRNFKLWSLVGLLPMVVLVLLRGAIGPDTPMYQQNIELIQSQESFAFIFEPGFELIILAISRITLDSLLAVKIIALITLFFLFSSDWLSPLAGQIISFALIPYFFLDMTMNGLRYGLAFALCLYTLSQFYHRNYLQQWGGGISAVLIQISSVYVLGFLSILFNPKLKSIFVIIFLAGSVLFSFYDYLFYKASVNQDLRIVSASSGLAPLLLSSISIAGILTNAAIRVHYLKQFCILFLMAILTYGLTLLYAAGLRFQQLNLFTIFLAMIFACSSAGIIKSKPITLSLLLVGILGSFFRLNNFIGQAGLDPSSFLPYRFFWE
jgi:hypothetical protein